MVADCQPRSSIIEVTEVRQYIDTLSSKSLIDANPVTGVGHRSASLSSLSTTAMFFSKFGSTNRVLWLPLHTSSPGIQWMSLSTTWRSLLRALGGTDQAMCFMRVE